MIELFDWQVSDDGSRISVTVAFKESPCADEFGSFRVIWHLQTERLQLPWNMTADKRLKSSIKDALAEYGIGTALTGASAK